MQKSTIKTIFFINNSGSALVFSVVFAAIFSIVGVGTISLISRGNQLHTRGVKIIKSYWANEGAMRVALRYLTREIVYPGDIADFNDNLTQPVNINGYQPDVEIDATGNRKYTVTVETTVDGMQNTTTMNQASFNTLSRFAWFQQGPKLPSPWGAAVFDGNFHSNERLYIYEDMTYEEHVTGEATCASDYKNNYSGVKEYGTGLKLDNKLSKHKYDWFHYRLPNYTGGVDPISTEDLAPDASDFANGWVIEDAFSGYTKYKIELDNSSGDEAKIYGYNSGWTGSPIIVKDISDLLNSSNGGIIKSALPIHIEGTLKGALTVVSDGDITLIGDILYDGVTASSLPELNDPNMLGIVAGNDIIIPEDFWDNSDAMYIYASLFAKNGYIAPEGGNLDGWNYGTSVNYLKIYGSSLINRQDNTFGKKYSGGVWKKKGFKLDVHGDPRYMQNIAAPPGIPSLKATDEEMINYHGCGAGDACAERYNIGLRMWTNEIL